MFLSRDQILFCEDGFVVPLAGAGCEQFSTTIGQFILGRNTLLSKIRECFLEYHFGSGIYAHLFLQIA